MADLASDPLAWRQVLAPSLAELEVDYWAEHEEALGAIVKHVLVHEIGHHFGLSDADMAAIERAAA